MDFLETAVRRIILKTYFYLEETGRVNSFERFPYLHHLTCDLNEQMIEAWEKDMGQEAQRYRGLLKELDKGDGNAQEEMYDEVFCNALDLALAAAYVPEFAAYLNYYTGNAVTVRLAFELERENSPSHSEVEREIKKLQKICRVDEQKQPLWYAAVEVDEALLAYLSGENVPPVSPFEGAEWFCGGSILHEMFVHADTAQQCADFLRGKNTAVQIAGSGGRRFLAKHIAALHKKVVLFVDAEHWKAFAPEERRQYRMELLRQAFLWKGLVCVYGITADAVKEISGKEEYFVKQTAGPLLDAAIPVIFCTSSEVRLGGGGRNIFLAQLGALTRVQREQVFRGFAAKYHLKADPVCCSIQYRLSASEIGRAVELLQSGSGNEDFSLLCYRMLSNKEAGHLGRVIRPSVGFSDLKAPADVMEQLEQICCSVKEGYRIYEMWNLGHQYPYGRAVSVLLAGAPGTGKTMTAHVLAKELGIPLYQVNLSNVMDKYIGETEKHLDQVFSFAEKTNLILFFDEADSLFGKRGEVTEGKDRYANMEVSYILQRIEQFEGIVVLATNFYGNIDKAFLRRMKYVIRYQAPDEATRRCIWESCMPPELPKEEIDLDYLASGFDLTGGMIKNIVLNACVMALREQSPLGMRQLLCSIRSECKKMERNLGNEVWGKYGYLL